MSENIYLGIDGGGTKTTAVIIDAGGRIRSAERTGGSAIVGKPSDRSCAVLGQLVEAVCKQAGVARGDLTRCAIGLNGIDFADELSMQTAELSAALGIPLDTRAVVNDGIVALWGATSREPAAMLQHGSGFTGAYRGRYGEERLFDHLSIGRTFDMRYELVALVARMIDGRVQPTPLKEKVLAWFDVREGDYCESIFRGWVKRERIATTPPLIFDAWASGDDDDAADTLIQRAAADYALAATAMLARVGSDDADVIFGGGVIEQAPEAFWKLLSARVREHLPNARTRPPDLPPEYGAAIMAGYLGGCDPRGLFEKVLQNYVKQSSASSPPKNDRTGSEGS